MRFPILKIAATAAWLLLCFTVLLLSLGGENLPRPGEAEMVLVGGMMLLGFPSTGALALVEAGAMRWLYECCGVTYPSGDLVRIVRWIVYVAVGALQWYVLVPFLIRWMKAKTRPTPA